MGGLGINRDSIAGCDPSHGPGWVPGTVGGGNLMAWATSIAALRSRRARGSGFIDCTTEPRA